MAARTLHGHPLPHAEDAEYGDPRPPHAPAAIIPIERALDRLAQRLGHDDHQRLLRGTTEPTTWYEYGCLSFERAIATMDVQRETAH